LLYYLLFGIPVLLIIGFFYASRRQARVTAAVVTNPEPEIDLGYRPTVSDEPVRDPPTARDPALARMSTEELVIEVLRECQDPEIPLSIVDLGLVYEVTAAPDSVMIKMSMTAPDCPSHHSIAQDVRAKLEDAGFPNPQVEVVWDPPWTPHRISEEGKKKLGM
jgi:metal-sulfur cluster biosynthetic enzyme